jgi:hypothetical protein
MNHTRLRLESNGERGAYAITPKQFEPNSAAPTAGSAWTLPVTVTTPAKAGLAAGGDSLPATTISNPRPSSVTANDCHMVAVNVGLMRTPGPTLVTDGGKITDSEVNAFITATTAHCLESN